MNGFTYNGIHSETLGCWYIPDASDNWRASPEYEVMDQDVVGRNGGYYYGNRVKSRVFTLKMYFEDITAETRERIRAWLDRKTSGRLIFDDRPFVYYNVRPTKTEPGKLYTTRHGGSSFDRYSGTFTLTFTAYEAFGFLKYKYYTDYDQDGAGVYCGMLEENEMPAAPTAASESFLLYNCGTEPCGAKITLAGSAPNGVVIKNKTNGTKCALNAQPAVGSLEIDPGFGTVHVITQAGRALNYQYHDEGFLKQDPAGLLTDDVAVTTAAGSAEAEISPFDDASPFVGKHVLLPDGWKKIVAADGNTVTLEAEAADGGTVFTKIAQMNEIEIEGTGVTLTRLEIDYDPMIV